MTRIYKYNWKLLLAATLLGLCMLFYLSGRFEDTFYLIIFIVIFASTWSGAYEVTLSEETIKLDPVLPSKTPQVIYLADVVSYKEECMAFTKRPCKGTIISRHGEKMVIRSNELVDFKELSRTLSDSYPPPST
ncbi:hypothetical protein SAMN02745181_0506 [Rubritalea squalenifaciens DSM 18772]|uniref:Uncharacterized protein n=1 Tax=Rubritalea squalenifaciens DSM 18772 TaxID=1123071 RepID=A0A1M6CKZ4_9BACT|nr:hypothetical protein SAMN02745181_0506 [Rubritalea squalenifaciens DSM 18772]